LGLASFFDVGNQTYYEEKAKRLELMMKELDNDYQRIILRFSQIMKDLHET
jgi:hypothetical protein